MKHFAGLAFMMALGVSLHAGPVIETDICVYGATSGGVAASVAAARLGKTVALVSLNNHVGGMSASGLGVTDIGPGNDARYVSGISREFYQRMGAAYGASNLVIWFEPHVAENVFRQMLAEVGVTVYSNKLLAATTMVGNRITKVTTEDGAIFRAKQFIDTTYEGDLMASAAVTFTWGREGNSVYNESLAGIRTLGGNYNYDPFVLPGNPSSGVLPLVNTNTGGFVGEGDQRLQAYNFRLCLTQNATNQIPIAPPPGYLESDYELVRRYVAARVAQDGAVSLGQLIHIQTIIPNGKTDINANGELSTDYVGFNYTWATHTYAGREIIRQQHENYIRGLLHFYATSTNIPANLNTEMQSWGLAADEFADNSGWPWQIYVREARRMIGDYVMTQSNCEARVIAPESICLARYHIDSHGVQRLPSGNFSRWEGSIGGTPPYPYPVSYRSIIPRSNECENVFATFALSASHVAFASCRMEPVFMMSSHAAGVAASFAIDDNVPVQQLAYHKLAAQLRADGQLLKWEEAVASTNGIILDQGGAGTVSVGSWMAGANAGGWNGDYWHDGASGKGTKAVIYTPMLPTNGTYEVYAWWVESSNRPTNTPYDIIHASGTNRVLVNQKVSSGGWFKLLTTNFSAGTSGKVIIRNDNTPAGTYCVADGVRFLGLGAAAPNVPPPSVDVIASDAVAGEFGTNLGRFTFVRSGDTNGPLTLDYTFAGSASGGVDYGVLPASVVLPAGVVATNVMVTPIYDLMIEGLETVELILQSSPQYTVGPLNNAVVWLHDRPFDEWRAAQFVPAEWLQPGVCGDDANPDGDGLPNLMECYFGSLPKQAEANPFVLAQTNGGFEITAPRSKTVTDISFNWEWSPDLRQWFSGPGYLEPYSTNDAEAIEWINTRLGAVAATNVNGFIRGVAVRH